MDSVGGDCRKVLVFAAAQEIVDTNNTRPYRELDAYIAKCLVEVAKEAG